MNELGRYNGTVIAYHADDDTFVNATQMCKATGKRWFNYWRNETTQEFINATERAHLARKGAGTSLIRNDLGVGTFVHRRIAIHLAQWCSADFAVWVSEKIDQLMTTGSVWKTQYTSSRLDDHPTARRP